MTWLELTYRIKGEYGVHIELKPLHRYSKMFGACTVWKEHVGLTENTISYEICTLLMLQAWNLSGDLWGGGNSKWTPYSCFMRQDNPIGFSVIRECYQIDLWGINTVCTVSLNLITLVKYLRYIQIPGRYHSILQLSLPRIHSTVLDKGDSN